MLRSLRTPALLAVILAVAVVSAACSSVSDGADGGAETDGTSTTVVSTTTSVPSSAESPPRPSPGCAAPETDEVTSMHKDITVGEQARYYLLTTPPPTSEPVPLVLDLHGLMEGAQIHSIMTQFGSLAQNEGFIVAFPHGSGEPVRWDAAPTSSPNLDVEFLDAMIEELGATRCIDESRVYATGLSYGAIMSTFLACERSDVFAAIAPIDGLTVPEGCNLDRPVPALSSHGTEDPILLFNGGYGDIGGLVAGDGTVPTATSAPADAAADLNGPGYPEAVAEWAALNGCSDEFTDTDVSETVVHRVYDCPAESDVEFYIVKGGGHSWPSSEFSKSIEQIVGVTTFDIDATQLAWDFFQRFSLPNPATN